LNKISLAIRKITVPPLFAALLLLLTYIFHADYFGAPLHLLGGILFLCILPLLAYPLQKYIPHFKNKGRSGQRSLAMIFSAVGYLLGFLVAFIFKAPAELKFIYAEYLLCGIAMLVLNKVFKLKASGHACGIVGPVLLLLYFKMYIPAALGLALVLPVFIASVRTKQHTVPQLLGGSLIPVGVLLLLILLS